VGLLPWEEDVIKSPFERSHVCGGRSLIRGCGEPDLDANRPLWEALWREHWKMLLTEWIEEKPGTRPKAFYEFDWSEEAEQEEGETESEFLYRLGLMEEEEIQRIVQNAKVLADYDRGRNPLSNFVEPDEVDRFAIDQGLLTPEEVAILTSCD
jgi:hypothetical protein